MVARGQSRAAAKATGRTQAVTPEKPLEATGASLTPTSDNQEKVRHVNSPTRIIRALLLAAAAAVLAAAAYQLREKHQEAALTVQNIHDQLDALDPATRAAVVARLTSDEVKKVHGDLS